MFTFLQRWPRWLHILTIIFLAAWIVWLLPSLYTLARCSQEAAIGQTCEMNAWVTFASAINGAILLAAGWLAFFLCAKEQDRQDDEWKRWLLLGLISGAVVTLVGGLVTYPLYVSAGIAPEALVLLFLNLFIYGFLLSVWIVFPIHWAARFLRRSSSTPALRGSVLGGALGISYSILSLIVIPFISVFASVAFRLDLQNGLLSLLGYIQPLIFYILPVGVLQATPFSPSFEAATNFFSQLFSLPIFLFFNGVADVVILLVIGWIAGWIVGKAKKKAA